jgi:HAD superfamily phosphatase (TIGR01668 family)
MPIFKPTYLVDGDITDLSLQKLYEDGVRGIILDLDSTVIAPRSGHLTMVVEEWLENARKDFKLAVVSNNKNEPYMKEVEKLLKMPVIGRAAKPSIRVFKTVLNDFVLPASAVVVVGDRPLTDVWGGQRAGIKASTFFPQIRNIFYPKLGKHKKDRLFRFRRRVALDVLYEPTIETFRILIHVVVPSKPEHLESRTRQRTMQLSNVDSRCYWIKPPGREVNRARHLERHAQVIESFKILNDLH